MPLNDDESGTLKRLIDESETNALVDARHGAYFEGSQRLEHLGLAIPPDLRRFETVVNWPRLTVDRLEERLDIEGFRFEGDPMDDRELWEGWQANNLDEASSLAHVDALVYGRSFVCVGSNEDAGLPVITVESPLEMTLQLDPRKGRVTSAVRLYQEDDEQVEPNLATLYLPDATIWLEKRFGAWVEVDRDPHGLGRVPVVPILNRRRTGSWRGRTEMADVIPLTDAAARSLTNLQVAGETHAVPQRYVLGASKGDFVDSATGEPLTTWQAYFSGLWAMKTGTSVGQLTASDLRNFHETVNHYARHVAALTGLPPHFLGFTTDNPASAEAIRSAETTLIKRSERTQTAFGGAWEQVMRLYLRLRDGRDDPRAASLETRWRDPGTPTYAAKADAVVKLFQSGLLPAEAAWEELGYSETRRTQLREMRANDLALGRDVPGSTSATGDARVRTGNDPNLSTGTSAA